eukprot:8272443-Pyramimonas_sp.AAC.2
MGVLWIPVGFVTILIAVLRSPKEFLRNLIVFYESMGALRIPMGARGNLMGLPTFRWMSYETL